MKAILICGDRNWDDAIPIARVIDEEKPDRVVHGDARGADRMGGQSAELRGIEVVKFPAQWDVYGRAAGPIRNDLMKVYMLTLESEGWEVSIHAFHDNLEESKGTKDMVNRCELSGLSVEVHNHHA